jgi:two-component system, chemotaxis family, sensor kinase CheA
VNIDHEAILHTFLAETEEHLCRMEEALVSLETQPEDGETLQTIFRVVHTLKGNASSLGYPRVAGFAHAVEDTLQRLRDRTLPVSGDLITLLLQAVDALRQMVPDAIAGNEEVQPGFEKLLKVLGATGPIAVDEEKKTAMAPTEAERRQRSWGRRKEDIQTWKERGRSLRVDIEKLDRILNLTGEIAIARGRLRQMLKERTGRVGEEVLEAHLEADPLYLELQELVMKARMVPVGPTFRQYVRTVRDMASATGKMVRIHLEGEDVEVDTRVIEQLRDPLTHMIRNAVDHGIESTQVRQGRGKDPCGRITLRACHEAGSIVIQVIDDGSGLDRERIMERAKSQGLATEPEKLTDDELYQLVFEPGFSTAETVTDFSGRGVGMDIVRRNVDSLRGSVSIDSRQGEGTTISIRLPLTLAIIEGFGVGVGDETYVIPLEAVLECLGLPADERSNSNGHGVIYLRGRALPYLRLRKLFSLGDHAPARENIVVVQHGSGQAGVAVDVLYGACQAIIKPLGELFQGLPGIAGSTILGNGRVALILDVPSLLREAVGRQSRSVGDASRPVTRERDDPPRTSQAPLSTAEDPCARKGGGPCHAP